MSNIPTASLIFYPAFCFRLSPTYGTWARLTATDVYSLRERVGFEGAFRAYLFARSISLRCDVRISAFCAAADTDARFTGQNLYFYLNHPIKWIRLVGIVVTFDIQPTRFIMILDDSSGSTIEVTCGRKIPPPKYNNTDIRAVEDYLYGSKTAAMEPSEPDTRGVTATGYDIDLRGVDIGSVLKVKGGIGDFRGQRQLLLERISAVQTTTEEAAAWAENTAFKRDILGCPWIVSQEDYTAAKRKAEGVDRESKRKMKERKSLETGKKTREKAALVGRLQSGKVLRRRDEDERRWQEQRMREGAEEQDTKRIEEAVMKRIEREDADRKQRHEVVEKMREEHERKLKAEEIKKREAIEEQQRLATERKQLNEVREKVLRDMGAGR